MQASRVIDPLAHAAMRLLPKPQTLANQDRLFRYFILVSVAGHLLFWLVQGISLMFGSANPVIDEWAMDADLITDLQFSAPTMTALPDAKTAPEATVPSQLLPQLPKKFEVKEAEKAEDTVADKSPEPDAKAEAEEKKAAQPVAVVRKEDVEEKNRIAMDDALKRLAVERLRQQQKDKQTEMKAPKVDDLARLKEELAQRSTDLNSGVKGLGSSAGQDRYRGLLQKSVGRHYALPEAYNMKNANLRVVVAIVVNNRGELLSCSIHQSSGDKLFDNLAYKAVKDAAPLPKPPDDQAGEPIYLHFTPKSF